MTLKELRNLFPDATLETWHQHPNGSGWVQNTATVSDNAYIGPSALVYGDAQVYGDAKVYGDAMVYGNAQVYGDARVSGNAQVYCDARVYGYARVSGYAMVSGDARVSGDAMVYGNAQVYGGRWAVTPLQINGTMHSFNVCSATEIQIACKTHTVAWWEAHYVEVGTREGYTQDQIEEYGLYIKLAKEWLKKYVQK